MVFFSENHRISCLLNMSHNKIKRKSRHVRNRDFPILRDNSRFLTTESHWAATFCHYSKNYWSNGIKTSFCPIKMICHRTSTTCSRTTFLKTTYSLEEKCCFILRWQYYELKIEEIANDNKWQCCSCQRKIMNQSIAVSQLQLEDATCIQLVINIIRVQAKGKDKVLFSGTVLFSGAFRL